jgi:hypothetical protein
MSGPALLELEDERFMEKYPQFAYLFTKVEVCPHEEQQVSNMKDNFLTGVHKIF